MGIAENIMDQTEAQIVIRSIKAILAKCRNKRVREMVMNELNGKRKD